MPCRELVTETHSWIPVLSELAMPFYLTHQQVLVPLAAGASWVPHLRTFPLVLLLATLATLALSWSITQAGPLRYFFGLPAKQQSRLPGKQLAGFLPLLIMAVLFVLAALLGNLL